MSSEESKKEMKEAEKLRKRREARQKKILQSAGNRLHKITTAHGGESPILSSSQQSSPTGSEASFNPFSSSRKSSFSTTSRPNLQLSDPIPPVVHEEPESIPIPQSLNSMPNIKISQPDTENFFSRDASSGIVYPLPTLIPGATTPPIQLGQSTDPSFSSDQQNDLIDQEHLHQMIENMRRYNNSSGSINSTNDGFPEEQPLFPGGFHPPHYPSLTPEDQSLLLQQLQNKPQEEQSFVDTLFPFLPEMLLIGSLGSNGKSKQADSEARLWKLIHFVVMVLLGIYMIFLEFKRESGAWHRFAYLNDQSPYSIINNDSIESQSLFWYFAVLELLLQSSRILLQQERTFHGSNIGKLVSRLPSPFSEVLIVLMRYRLIWNSLWEDITVLVFMAHEHPEELY
ncbi:hypothetical protein G9A89_008291 [Geosiphon pyriformis]|nr:hypothetical protein G9A89_008291 [Geosiphon pyriformis]